MLHRDRPQSSGAKLDASKCHCGRYLTHRGMCWFRIGVKRGKYKPAASPIPGIKYCGCGRKDPHRGLCSFKRGMRPPVQRQMPRNPDIIKLDPSRHWRTQMDALRQQLTEDFMAGKNTSDLTIQIRRLLKEREIYNVRKSSAGNAIDAQFRNTHKDVSGD